MAGSQCGQGSAPYRLVSILSLHGPLFMKYFFCSKAAKVPRVAHKGLSPVGLVFNSSRCSHSSNVEGLELVDVDSVQLY